MSEDAHCPRPTPNQNLETVLFILGYFAVEPRAGQQCFDSHPLTGGRNLMRMPRRLVPGLALFALSFLAVSGRAAETDKFVPNNADVIVVVNVRQITESKLFKTYEGQLKDFIKTNADAKKALEDLGIDPFKDVYTVVIAGPGGKQDEGLVIVEGRFNRAKFEAKAEAAAKDPKEGLKIIKEGNYKLYETRGQERPRAWLRCHPER